jgi:hypothetical protein
VKETAETLLVGAVLARTPLGAPPASTLKHSAGVSSLCGGYNFSLRTLKALTG